jgi:hypothetical protein
MIGKSTIHTAMRSASHFTKIEQSDCSLQDSPVQRPCKLLKRSWQLR